MSSKLSLAGIMFISASEDGIWTLITDYCMSTIYDMHSFVLVSKSFYKMFTSRRGRFSKIVGHSFTSLLKTFFAPICNPGINEFDFLDSFFKFLNQFQYDDMPYCISGGFALAILLGANLSSPEWKKVDLDIYLSNRDYIKFMRALARWSQEQHIISCDYQFYCANFNFEPDWQEWETAPDWFLDNIVEFTVKREDITKNRRIKFYFVIAELMSPKQYCEKVFPFTFLMNSVIIKSDWKVPRVSMKHARDVLEKDGCYSDFFKAYWESQWKRWQDPRHHLYLNTKFHFLIAHDKKSINYGQQKATTLKHTRQKYESRGFFIHGPLPKHVFVQSHGPYEQYQRNREEHSPFDIKRRENTFHKSPYIPIVQQSSETLLMPDHNEQEIRYCQVFECTDACFIYAGDIDMYLCYRHRQFSAEDKSLQTHFHQEG